MGILIGADPEVFLRDSTGQIVSAIGRLGGTKASPIPCDFGAVQEDNVLAEYNITPASSADKWVWYHKAMLEEISKRTGCTPVAQASHVFDTEYLKTLGKQAIMFGCEPDYNAYTGRANRKPNPFQGMRTAGGHIHVGFLEEMPDTKPVDVVRAMDSVLGVPSVLLDADDKRRSMYGKAGCYRDKPYGVEYRTLSSFWLGSYDLMRWAYNATIVALSDVSKWSELAVSQNVRAIIDNNDKDAARKFVKNNGLLIEV